MLKQQRLITIFVLSIALSGCYSRYVAPDSGPSATIVFHSMAEHSVSIYSFATLKDCKDKKGTQRLPQQQSFWTHDDLNNVIPIPANQYIVVGYAEYPVGGVGVTRSCNSAVAFNAEANKHYQINTWPPYSAHECFMSVSEQDANSGQFTVPVQSDVFREDKCE